MTTNTINNDVGGKAVISSDEVGGVAGTGEVDDRALNNQ